MTVQIWVLWIFAISNSNYYSPPMPAFAVIDSFPTVTACEQAWGSIKAATPQFFSLSHTCLLTTRK